jgi:twitching motility protein PilT
MGTADHTAIPCEAVSAQLDQILGYLDRAGVSEIVISSGRPIAMKQNNAFAQISARPLTAEQVMQLVADTSIAALVPSGDGTRPPTEVDVGRRRLRAHVGRRGAELVIRLESAGEALSAEPPVAVRASGSALPPRTSAAPAPTSVLPPRTSAAPAPTSALPPRAKAPTGSHGRAKMPTGSHGKTPTSAPRAKKPSSVPFGTLELDDSPPEAGRKPTLDLDPLPNNSTFELDLDPVDAAAATRPASAPAAPASAAPAAASARRISASDMTSFASLVRIARERGASDLHISSSRHTSVRVGGELLPIDAAQPEPTLQAVEAMLLPLLSPAHVESLGKVGYVDLAVDAPGGGRLRANISRHQNGLKGTFRLAMPEPATLEALGLPADLAKVVHHHQGLVVIAGPSGHGKTTTLASLVDLVNSTKAFHILTVEDPIEIVHPRKTAVVSQREAVVHTRSFVSALKASLREDPDVIVIGELRDRETVEIALTASETGHLVIATMSTPSAAKTLDRLIDMFPPEEHSQVRASVAGALRAIVAQRLLPGTRGGVVPAVEVVTGVLPLAVLIRDDKLYQLPNLMQRGRAYGMIRFDESLADLVRAGKITEETALASADAKKELYAVLHPGAAAAAAPPPAQKSRLGGLFGKKEGE